MAVDIANTSSQSIYAAGITSISQPFTWSGWLYPDDLTTPHVLFDIQNFAATHWLNLFVHPSLDILRFDAADGGANRQSQTGNSINELQWNHCFCRAASVTDRKVMLNGDTASAGVNTVSCNPTVGEYLSHGKFHWSGDEYGTRGALAELAMWNVALTDEEGVMLSLGVSPLLVRPQSLVYYVPAIREIIDIVGGQPITQENSPTVSTHPRVFYPAPQQIRRYGVSFTETTLGVLMANEALLSLRRDAILQAEAKLAAEQSVATRIEGLHGVALDEAAGTEASGIAAMSAELPAEALQPVEQAIETNPEGLQGVVLDEAVPTEATQGVAVFAPARAEATGAVVTGAAIGAEALVEAAVSTLLEAEALLAAASGVVMTTESLEGVAGGMALEVEAQGQNVVRLEVAANVEALQGIRVTAGPSAEATASVEASALAGVEALVSLLRSALLTEEALKATAAAAAAPAEASGSAAISVAIPAEALASLIAAAAFSTEGLSPAARTVLAVVEALAGVGGVVELHIEADGEEADGLNVVARLMGLDITIRVRGLDRSRTAYGLEEDTNLKGKLS